VDGTGGPAAQEYALAFSNESGRVEMVGSTAELQANEGDRVVRAPGATLLPGLINIHVHLNLASDNAPSLPYMDAHSDVALALRSVSNAQASQRLSCSPAEVGRGRGTCSVLFQRPPPGPGVSVSDHRALQ
jgi:imidazolonepropionase-like amidohydrolase